MSGRSWEERRQAIAHASDKAGRTRDLLVRHGHRMPDRGWHRTFGFESASGVYTELQCGSYISMGADYRRSLDRDGAPTKAVEPSLCIWATVMSRPIRTARSSAPPSALRRGEARLREVIKACGFVTVRRGAETPFNIILETEL